MIENRVTLGNVLSLLGTLLAAGSIIVTIAVWTGRQGQRLDAVESAILETRTTVSGQEARIRAIETNSARQDERLLLILDTVRKIEAKLERTAK